jgi:hypothetical protein
LQALLLFHAAPAFCFLQTKKEGFMNLPKRARTGAGSSLPACFLGAALGGILFLLIYGLRPLDVTYDAWILNGYVETDITQRYAGWLAYRAAPGFFPLTFSPMISFPFGGYTSLCDSIPLLEVFFKLFSPVLPATFQFEGIACFAAMLLQGFCGALLVSRFTSGWLCAALGGGVFCLSPILLERMFRHTSLSAHWMLLLAIWLYFTARRHHSRACWYGFAALCVFSVGIHLYFTPMLLGFFTAAVLDEAVQRKSLPKSDTAPAGDETADNSAVPAGRASGFIPRTEPFILLIATAALCLGFAALLGDLAIGAGNTSGYGTMGMNLNALFNPKSLGPNWWVPGQGTIDWSLLLPMRALAENNLESFNYLGLGVLIALGFAAVYLLIRLVRRPKALAARFVQLLKRYPFLLCFAAFSTLFAVSNVVCAFSHVLVRIPLPQAVLSICSAFRASGRLFWSVSYLLVLCCVVFFLRHVPAVSRPVRCGQNVTACAALAVLLLVQAADLSPALALKHADFAAAQPWNAQLSGEELLRAMEGRTVLYNLELRDDRPMCAFLLKHGVGSNYWLISRDAYGVPELNADISASAEALLAGRDPYAGECAYCTADAATADKMRAAGWKVAQTGSLWIILT